MPNIYSSKQITDVLEKVGFRFVSQNGSHGKYKDFKGNIAIVPMRKKEIPEGTLRNILRQSDITLRDFKDNL